MSEIQYLYRKSTIDNEVKIQSQLQHQNILKAYVGFATHTKSYRYCIILERSIMTLKQQIDTWHMNSNWHQEENSLDTVLDCCYQITEGLNYLHQNDVMHGNLEPDNIHICESNEQYLYKIANFRSARSSELEKETSVQSINYAAPEMFTEVTFKFSSDIDIWALGCIFFEISSGKMAFPGCGAIFKIKECKYEPLLMKHDILKSLVQQMICLDNRISAGVLVKSLKELIDANQQKNLFEQNTNTSSYDKIKLLGADDISTVYAVICKQSSRDYAMKTIRLGEIDSDKAKQTVDNFALYKKLNHNNIVKIYSVFSQSNDQNEQSMIIIMELGKRSLQQQIQIWHSSSRWQKNNTAAILDYMLQMTTAMAYYHHKNFTHGDLKPSNIIVFEQGTKLILKLSDFGTSSIKHMQTDNKEQKSLYMPPEFITNSSTQRISTNSDIWSLGCIFIELTTGIPAFSDQNLIIAGQYNKNFIVEQQIRKITELMLKVDQNARISSYNLQDCIDRHQKQQNAQTTSLFSCCSAKANVIPTSNIQDIADEDFQDIQDNDNYDEHIIEDKTTGMQQRADLAADAQ